MRYQEEPIARQHKHTDARLKPTFRFMDQSLREGREIKKTAEGETLRCMLKCTRLSQIHYPSGDYLKSDAVFLHEIFTILCLVAIVCSGDPDSA